MFIVNQGPHQMDKSHGCKILAKHVKYFHTVLGAATSLSVRQHEPGTINLVLCDGLLDDSKCKNAARGTLASLASLAPQTRQGHRGNQRFTKSKRFRAEVQAVARPCKRCPQDQKEYKIRTAFSPCHLSGGRLQDPSCLHVKNRSHKRTGKGG